MINGPNVTSNYATKAENTVDIVDYDIDQFSVNCEPFQV